jgi:phosphopantothenoylcysteine decarboxylase/phosphopantothenate--cysteine ligase
MHLAVKSELKKKIDIVVMAAAVADYVPTIQNKNKIKSSKLIMTISLKKAPKIIDQIKKYQKNVFLVGFKAETNLTKNQLIKSAEKKLNESSADMIIANDVGSIRYMKNPQKNQVIIVDSKKNIVSGWMSKEKIAKLIRKQIEVKIK